MGESGFSHPGVYPFIGAIEVAPIITSISFDGGEGWIGDIQIQSLSTPEPGTLGIAAVGIALIALFRRTES